MSYLIIKNSFAMKCSAFRENENAHSISYNKCNYDCEYCAFHYYKLSNNYLEYDTYEFKRIVENLLCSGSVFKFTGGEPTLNPRLYDDIKIVKELGGTVFLDTNASRPRVVQQLAEDNLVDLFGISLKGLSAEETNTRTGLKPELHVFDKTINTIKMLTNDLGKKTIVTYVCYDDFMLRDLTRFSELLSGLNSVHLKINNYQPDAHHKARDRKPIDNKKLINLLKVFVNKYPEWEGRVTIVPDKSAVENMDNVIML